MYAQNEVFPKTGSVFIKEMLEGLFLLSSCRFPSTVLQFNFYSTWLESTGLRGRVAGNMIAWEIKLKMKEYADLIPSVLF